MKNLGCCAILEPRKLNLVYIDIDESHSAAAEKMLVRGRASLVQLRSSDLMTKTINPARGVEPGEQELLGTLAATLAEVVTAYDSNHPALPVLALALYRIRPKTAFIVRANVEDEGTQTTFIDVDCTDPSQARSAIENSPEIKMLRDFQAMRGLLSEAPKSP